MEPMLFGFTPLQLRQVAGHYDEANNIRFKNETKEAGVDLFKCFMSRHNDNLSLRTPEATSAARTRGSIKLVSTNVSTYWSSYKRNTISLFMSIKPVSPHYPTNPSRIIGSRGKNK